MDSQVAGASGRCLLVRSTGQPTDVLELTPFTPKPPESGEVLVRVLASPINPADLNIIAGTYGVQPELPAVPGIEGCGVVEESRADEYEPGDAVIFLCRACAWATHVTVPGKSLFKLPPGIDLQQAALLKTNPATAWQLLHNFETLRAGDWIVQNLGNSAVGRCVIQLARELGVGTVSFVRRPAVIDELRELGADHVFIDDAHGRTAAKDALDGPNAVVAFNGVGGDSASRLTTLLREGGTHVTYGSMGRAPVTIANAPLIFRDIRIRGLWITRWIEQTSAVELRLMYQQLARRVLDGSLVQRVDRTFLLDAYRDALSRLDAPDRNGKVLFHTPTAGPQ